MGMGVSSGNACTIVVAVTTSPASGVDEGIAASVGVKVGAIAGSVVAVHVGASVDVALGAIVAVGAVVSSRVIDVYTSYGGTSSAGAMLEGVVTITGSGVTVGTGVSGGNPRFRSTVSSGAPVDGGVTVGVALLAAASAGLVTSSV